MYNCQSHCLIHHNDILIDILGLDKVISRGDLKPYGITYTISPSVSGQGIKVKLVSCFQDKATKDDPVMPQSILPDLTGFKVHKHVINSAFFIYIFKGISSLCLRMVYTELAILLRSLSHKMSLSPKDRVLSSESKSLVTQA